MATALSLGILKSGILGRGSSVIVSDPYKAQLTKLSNSVDSLHLQNIGFETTTNNIQCIQKCDVVFLAVKPQYLPPIMKELHSSFSGKEIIVSMIPGVSLHTLQTQITDKASQPIIRIMPNTPALVGCAAISITKGIFMCILRMFP